MTLETWLLFCITETVLCLIPGPAVLYVVSTALGQGVRPGIGASLGILSGNTLYFVLSATGVAAVIVASSGLFHALKLAGAAYLVWLGLRMLLSRGGATAAAAATMRTPRRIFLRGFLIQAGNPKALVFFIALLPQFIDPRGSVAWQILVLGASSVLIEFLVLGAYAVTAARAGQLAGARLAGPLERIGGGLLLVAGARLAFLDAD
ncbi:MAG: LysE family translocator [Pseudomonadota bacterium]